MAQHLEREVGSMRITPAEDLGNLNGQLDHIVARVAEAARQLRRQQEELLRTEQLAAVGQLAAGVAHEVRNPLMSIKLLIEASLRSNGRQPLNRRDLEVIHGEVARLEQTVQDFLDFARPTAPRRQNLDLREPLNSALALVRTRAKQQNVRVELQTPDHPVPAEVDRDQLQTVLVNLLLNALDAMPQGGVLHARLGCSENGSIVLSIADTGAGIPSEILPRLFTPFLSSKPTGTGLGLSISRRIIQDHGGRLEASNLPEGGACFRIVIPSVETEAAHADLAGHR
jgi:signal transduction histidine kinase